VFACAASDSRAERILVNAANAVAEAIVNCVMLLDVECVVVGGSVGLAPGMVERIRSALQTESDLTQIPVTKAVLGTDSGLIGAARWATGDDRSMERASGGRRASPNESPVSRVIKSHMKL
jgi:N-acylmannosamine kinase